MISTLGPFTPASGTPIKLNVRTDAVWLYIYNDSPLSILGQFDGVPPTAVTSLDGAYNFAVRPHSDPVIPVQKGGVSAVERQINGIAQFGGVVYLMPRDPGGLAVTGSISTRAEIFITVGGPADEPPTPSSTQRQTDLSSQPRVVTIPVPVGSRFDDGHLIGTGVQTFNYGVSTYGGTSQFLNAYLHYLYVSVYTANAQVDWQISYIGLANGVQQNTDAVLFHGRMQGASSLALSFPNPNWGNQQMGVFGINQTGFQMKINSSSIAATMVWAFGVTQDTTSIENVGVIGQGQPSFYGNTPTF